MPSRALLRRLATLLIAATLPVTIVMGAEAGRRDEFITPRTPRAIYFNDDASVGSLPVYARLVEILSGRDNAPAVARLRQADRTAIADILRATPPSSLSPSAHSTPPK